MLVTCGLTFVRYAVFEQGPTRGLGAGGRPPDRLAFRVLLPYMLGNLNPGFS